MGFTNPGLQRTPILKVTATAGAPQEFTAGTWDVATLNGGVWSTVLIPNAASGVPFLGFKGIATQALGGLWMNASALELYGHPAGVDLLAFSQAMTWSANQRISITMNMAAKRLTITGATTGDGTFTWTQVGPYFDAAVSGGRLYVNGFQPPNPTYDFLGVTGNFYG